MRTTVLDDQMEYAHERGSRHVGGTEHVHCLVLNMHFNK